MNSSQAPQHGTVADRIRAFQDVQILEPRAPTLNLPPRILTHAKDSGIYEAQRRGESLSFASPTGRPSRIGIEHLRGDGRPPLGSISYKQSRSPKRMRGYEDKVKVVPARPVTSLDEAFNASTVPRASEDQIHQLHRRFRSMETADDPRQEIAVARLRLRSVVEDKSANETPPPERPCTLAELNNMLDHAIEGAGPQTFSDDDDMEILAQKPATIDRPTTDNTMDHRSQSRVRDNRRSIESRRPRSSSEKSLEVNYQNDPILSPLEPFIPEKEKRLSSLNSSLAVAGRSQKPIHSQTKLTPAEQLQSHPGNELSPVKRKTAIFESLNKRPDGYGEAHKAHNICQAAHDVRDQHQGPKKMHRIKFGETIEERPGTPLIPLALPAMVHEQQKSEGAASPLERNDTENGHGRETDEETPGDENMPQDKQRKTSMVWPFKWGLFNKTTPATLQAPEQTSSDETKREPAPPSHDKPGIVRSRVHELLQAASERDDAQKHRSYAERERFSRRQTRAPTMLIKESVLREDKAALDQLEPEQIPPLQIPTDEETKGLKPQESPEDIPLPKTPLHRAMSEKQVLAPRSVVEAEDVPKASPVKSPPQTPIRGRPRKSIHRASVGAQHGVEQHFKLSPGPSRSASTNGRGGVKVEVEVRDSPGREARERGEKIVIIRADVEGHDGED
ncbi:hypothetical protein PV08_01020 [Exophiala spinifera]|uniref:Uncharacterized protein n=1 Tax=Exophiala spinifera TaxID=91928 RepID=A0A0D2BPJ5_9EURO|nr:uncharacterized protein PV08_01020 [Exophiala spinifera]KIW20445.1 hypothetical protein PV08_01020 [Exophiala spinifera]